MVKVILPDGSTSEFHEYTTPEQLIDKIRPEYQKTAVAAKINGVLADLCTPIKPQADTQQTIVQIITINDAEGLDICVIAAPT